MKRSFREQKGFTLIITILSLFVISTLGLAILGLTNSNFIMANIDSRSQSAFYIAEAGINYMIDKINTEVHKDNIIYEASEDFFEDIENSFTDNNIDFENNNGLKPTVSITVSQISEAQDKRDYKIESVGKIGSSTRTVSSVITVTWGNVQNMGNMENIFVYGPKFTFKGGQMNGEGGTIVSGGLMTHNLSEGGAVNVSNIYFAGPLTMSSGSTSFGSQNEPGIIYIDGNLNFTSGRRNVYGDVHVNGDATLKDAIFHGDIYVNGNVKFIENGPTINKNLFYTGTIEAPSWYQEEFLSKCIKVDSVQSFTIPLLDIKLKTDSWFTENRYEVRGDVSENVIPNNAKIIADNYYSKHHTSPTGDVIIISKKDIDISGWRHIRGALIAPNGTVKLSVGSFEGIIISKEGLDASQGGSKMYMLDISNFFTEITIPVEIDLGSQSDNEEEESEDIENSLYEKSSVKIKIPIKEK